MRPLEIILLGSAVIFLAARLQQRRSRQTTTAYLFALLLIFVAHLAVDGLRWTMASAYVLAAVGVFVFQRDLRHAVPGMTGKYPAFDIPKSRLALLGGGLLLGAVVGAILPGLLLPRVSFDRPSGFYPVGRLDVAWVDSSREETSTPAAGGKRTVLVTFWYPAEEAGGRLRYHPNPTALARGLSEQTGLPSLAFSNITRAMTNSTRAAEFNTREGRSPLILFSHGIGGTRMEGTFAFEELASFGFIVASIEHPYSAVGTVLPDGKQAASIVREETLSDADANALVTTWLADADFVLDRLERLPLGDASDVLARHVRLDRVGYVGHSLGGSVAATAAIRDARILAGVNMDGEFRAAAMEQGIRRPFLFLRAFPANADSVSADMLRQMEITRDSAQGMVTRLNASVAQAMRFGGTEIQFARASAFNFTDLARWSPFLARRMGVIGGVDPKDFHRAATTFMHRFFNEYLKDNTKATDVSLPADVEFRIVRHEAK